MTRAESQQRYPRGQGAGWRKCEEQTRTSVTTYLAQRRRAGTHWQQPEGEGRRGRLHTSARKARKRVQGQGAERHRCQVPSVLQQQGKLWAIREGGDTSDGVRVELLEGRRRGGPSPRHQGTKHWPGERDDPRGSRESRRKSARREWERGRNPNTYTAGPAAREINVYTAVRAAAQRTAGHSGGFGGADTKGESPANTPGIHSVEGHLKVSLRSGENDKVIGIELADVTEGVRGSEGDTRNGRTESGSETVDEQFEKKGRKNSALRNARVDPG